MEKEAVIALIKEHYSGSSQPLLLSEFGKILREQGLWPSQGPKRKLADYLRTLSPEVEVSQDDDTPAFKFVILPEFNDAVQESLIFREELAYLKRLPKSLVLAFGVFVPSGSSVYVQTVPPFRYRVARTEPPYECVRIGEQFRLVGLDLEDLDLLPSAQVIALSDKIDEWLEETGIPPETFAIFQPTAKKAHPAPRAQSVPAGASMLERLRAAQPDGIADQMVIPLDIALHLSKQS